MDAITFGILTISDTCANDSSQDKSGDELEHLVSSGNTKSGKMLKGRILMKEIVPDDEFKIMEILKEWSDNIKVNVILTTGGTGFSERDVTPEATKKIIDKEAPGISFGMFTASLAYTPFAMLSRSVCGIRKKTLIINLPGSPNAVRECLNSIAIVIPHAVHLILENKSKIMKIHEAEQKLSPHHHTCSHTQTNDSDSPLYINSIADRERESPYEMIDVTKAMMIMYGFCWDGKSESVDLWKSHERILSQDTFSLCNLPPFRASMKDGYAVIANDANRNKKVLSGVIAGDTPGTVQLSEGYCVRVNTGAPVPEEANAVVQVEDTKLIKKSSDGHEELEIEILVEPKEGQDIRPIGSDIRRDDLVLDKFTRIGAVEMGILASCGYSKVMVTKSPKIGVLSTGNELQEIGETLKSGHVYDSNRITLMMLLQENGYDPIDMGIVIDEENVMINTLRDAMPHVDVFITTGSVSMGDRDILKPILKNVFKADIIFGRVNMKPGKPTTFATCQYNDVTKYFLCLPGNPSSAFVTAHLFAIPLLNRLSGLPHVMPKIIKARLTCSYNLDSRPEFARVVLKWSMSEAIPTAYSTGNNISSKLLNCRSANALLMLPARNYKCSEKKEGDIVEAMLISSVS